jgi:hypothetical protein
MSRWGERERSPEIARPRCPIGSCRGANIMTQEQKVIRVSENMYFLGLTANRRVERDRLRRGGRGPAAWPDIDYVGSEF